MDLWTGRGRHGGYTLDAEGARRELAGGAVYPSGEAQVPLGRRGGAGCGVRCASRDAKRSSVWGSLLKIGSTHCAHALRGRGATAGCGTAKAETTHHPMALCGRAPHMPLVASAGPVCFLFVKSTHCELIKPSTLHDPSSITPTSWSNVCAVC